MKTGFDVIIIGAGIMGCATAFELAGRSCHVLVLEKGRIGAGPTGESSAIVRQHYSNPLTASMARFGVETFQNFEERVGEDVGFKRTGFLVLVGEKDQSGLKANIKMQQGIGIDTRLISREDILELMPGLDVSDTPVAAYEPGSGYADAYLTVTAYARAAARRGAEIRQRVEVTDVLFRSGRIVGVDTTRGKLFADAVVNCAGAWGARVASLAGIDIPIAPCRVQVALLRRPESLHGLHPVVIDFVNSSYFRADAGGVSIAGLVDPEEAKAIVHPDEYRRDTDFDFSADVAHRIVKRWPAMESATSMDGYASLYAITPDWHPVIDEVPTGSRFYISSGFSGHGFKLGPAVGRMTAGLVLGDPDPDFETRTFRLSRFEAGDLVHGRYKYNILG